MQNVHIDDAATPTIGRSRNDREQVTPSYFAKDKAEYYAMFFDCLPRVDRFLDTHSGIKHVHTEIRY